MTARNLPQRGLASRGAAQRGSCKFRNAAPGGDEHDGYIDDLCLEFVRQVPLALLLHDSKHE